MLETLLTQPVPGTLNFRAIDTYPASGGRIRPGALWRSGAFDEIGREGLARMRALGVTTVFDLRSGTEKRRRPSPLLAQAGFTVAEEPHEMHSGDLYAVLRKPETTPEDCADIMLTIYRRLPRLFQPVFSRCARTVTQSETPVAIHCTAGKDRTGVVVALILDLLGVSREDIFEDYLRSTAATEALRALFVQHGKGTDFEAVPLARIEPVIAADARYLRAMFDQFDAEFTSTEAYFRDVLRFSDADLVDLHARLII
jgi:protein-tyrosine phosphatase